MPHRGDIIPSSSQLLAPSINFHANLYYGLNVALEKENVVLLELKDSTTMKETISSSDELVKALSDLNIKEIEMQSLKDTTAQKDLQITTLNNLIREKDDILATIKSNRDKTQKDLERFKVKVLGRKPMKGAKHILWGKIVDEITKSRDYLTMIQDEYEIAISSMQRDKMIAEELVNNPQIAHVIRFFFKQ
jgi:hypothetical protein